MCHIERSEVETSLRKEIFCLSLKIKILNLRLEPHSTTNASVLAQGDKKCLSKMCAFKIGS